jgi:hypothetical protein
VTLHHPGEDSPHPGEDLPQTMIEEEVERWSKGDSE